MGTSNKNSCKTAAVMNLIGKGPAPERDIRVLPDKPRDIETITGEILEAKRVGGEAILTIGRGLMEAKALLSHGEWLPWLEERVEFSEKAAQRFMLLARKYSNPTTLSDLGASKALILLAIPDEIRDEYIEAPHVVNGEEKTVDEMSVRELKAVLLKERDEALKAAEQAQADFQVADAAREKLSQDMALANERIEGLNAEVAEKSAKVKETQDTVAQLEKELEEFRSRPVDVAVQADEAAVEAARKEVEERMQAQLDAAKKAQDQADEARKAALADMAKVQASLEQAQADMRAVQDQAAKAEKRAALTANEDFMMFRAMVLQMDVQLNQVTGVYMKIRDKSPELTSAAAASLLAYGEKVKGVAQR